MKGLVHMKQASPDLMDDMNDKPEQYSYGLRISLNEEDLKKVGLEMPAVGAMIHIMAMTKVTSIHAHDGESGSSHGVELQITHMKAEPEDNEGEDAPDNTRSAAQKIYGKK